MAGAAVVMVLVAVKIDRLSYQAFIQDLRLQTTLEMVEVRENIEEGVFDHILLLQRLASHISSHPDLDQQEYLNVARDLTAGHGVVLNLAAAPDLVVRFVYPYEPNRGAIGLDYRKRPDQLPEVMRAIDSGSVTITGPVDLVQGGRGLILRQPVYVTEDSGAASGELWGVVALVMDFEAFFAGVGPSDEQSAFDILVTAEIPDQSAPTPIFGVKDVALHDPVALDFDFPSGNWQLLGTTKGGWPAHQDNHVIQRTIATVLICLVLSILGFILYLSDSRGVLRRRFSDAIHSLGDGFAMFSPEGRLVAYNQKYVELYDTVADLIQRGARFEDLIRAGAARGQIANAIGREEEWVQERLHLFATTTTSTEQDLKNGRHIRVTDHRTDSGDVVCMRVDVTELNVARERAEAANLAKTTFLNTLSHELRTPLTVILAISRFFANVERLPAAKDVANAIDRGTCDPAEIRARVDGLLRLISDKMKMQERSGEHLLSMINEILDLAKIESGNLTVNLVECHTGEIMDSIEGPLRQAAEQKGLVLEVSGADEAVLGDEARTRQILLNLIGNAIKFTDSGLVGVDVRRRGTRVEFAVTDTGIGIAPEDMKRIFEPFQQVDSSDTRSRSGTGLGLAISAELARLQNGALSVESKKGVGSTFVLSLEASAALSRAV